MIQLTRPTRAERWLLAAILLLAALLRLVRPGLSEFKRDEAQIVLLAAEVAEGRLLSLTGTASSQGLPNPPLANYVYAVPLHLWRDPLSAVLFTGLLNVVAVWLGWRLARRYGGAGAGLAAALLLASSPWLVFFSRKVWQPSLFPFFALLWFETGTRALVEERRWALVAHLALLAALVLLQYGAIVCVPVTAVALGVYRRRVDRRALLLGLLSAFALSAPFIGYLLRDWRAVVGALAGVGEGAGRIDGSVFQIWWRLVTGANIAALAGSSAPQLERSLPLRTPVEWMLGGSTVLAAGYALWRWVRYSHAPASHAAGLAVVWAAAPLVLFTYHTMPLQLHYLLAAVPVAGILCLVWALRALVGRKSRWLRTLAWGSMMMLGLAQAVTSVALLAHLGRQATPGGYGMPLSYPRQAARDAAGIGEPVVVASAGDTAAFAEGPAVLSAVLGRTPHRLVDGTRTALWPAGGGSLIATEGAEAALRLYARAGALRTQRLVEARPGEAGYLVASIAADALLPIAQSAEGRYAHGVSLLGYSVEGLLAPGGIVDWTIAWQVSGPGADPTASYHITNQLQDASGARVAQADSGTLPTRGWAVGDRVVQTYTLAIPREAGEGPYTMRVAFYTYPELQVQMALDAAGAPVGDSVVLGPLQ